MKIKWSDMPSSVWKVWFLATKVRAFVLVATLASGFTGVFIAPANSKSFILLAIITTTGLFFVGLQQLFDFRYARKYLFSAQSS